MLYFYNFRCYQMWSVLPNIEFEFERGDILAQSDEFLFLWRPQVKYDLFQFSNIIVRSSENAYLFEMEWNLEDSSILLHPAHIEEMVYLVDMSI